MTLAGERRLPEKWNFGRSLLAKSQVFIHRNCVSSSYCFREHNEELKCIWLNKTPYFLTLNVISPLHSFSKREIACVITDPSLDLSRSQEKPLHFPGSLL